MGMSAGMSTVEVFSVAEGEHPDRAVIDQDELLQDVPAQQGDKRLLMRCDDLPGKVGPQKLPEVDVR